MKIAGRKLGGHMTTPIHKNIYLLNNVFHAFSGPALQVSGVSGLVAEGNVFSSGSDSGPLIEIHYSEDVQFNNNQGQDRIETLYMEQGEVRINGN